MPFLNRTTLAYPATNAFPNGIWEDTRDPTSADFRNFFPGTIWINFVGLTAWFMVDRSATSGTWVQAASTGTGILTITGDVGGAVSADGANNINLLSGSDLTVTGNPGTNTLTITLDGTIASLYTEDVGSATPSAGNLNIVGTGGITTSGAGDTVTITTAAIIPTTFTEDAGSAQPVANNLNVLGGTLCNTSGAGDTVTINVDSTVASTYTCDTGSATPAANNLNIIGAGSVVTSGAGSTVTITSTGGGLVWIEVTVVGPTSMLVDHGYIANSASVVQLTLPATAAQGSVIVILAKGSGGFQINQNAGQIIHNLSTATTVGVGGTVTSNNQYGALELVCITANTTWQVVDSMGNFDFI